VFAPASSVFKNRIINGDCRIDQRNAGAAKTDEGYLVDRWRVWRNQTYSIQQSTDAPTGFSNSLAITKTSTTQSTFAYLIQYIEGFNFANMLFGTANAKTVTLSFWVKSSVTGTFSAGIVNSASNRTYPATYTISAANTWEQKSVTIAGDTSGTWVGSTNGNGAGVWFNFGASGSGTANAWNAADATSGVTGNANLGTTNGATWYVTGVQLEVGTQATSFEYRQYGTELALCQRYYWQAATGATKELCMGGYYTSAQISMVMNMPVPMRTGPTISQTTGTDYYTIYRNGAGDGFNSLTIENAGVTMVSLFNETQISGTAGQTGLVRTTSASSSLGFNAEL
jgi:hypothetical protein